MLKRMRWRLIFSAVLAFAAVIALLAVLVNVVNYYVVTNRADQTISNIAGYEERIPPSEGPERRHVGPFRIFRDAESNYMMRFFIVRFDKAGQVRSVLTDYVASIDETEAEEYARQVLEKKSDRGYFREYRYAKTNEADEVSVVFLNVNREIQYMKSLRILTFAVSSGSLLLVFALVVLFSRRAIRPLANNMKRQKQFITDASHELKTPVTSISTSIDVISMEHGEDEWTENIRTQTRRMSKLVSELVMLSRLDEDLPLPNKEHFSLSDAAWEILDVYQPQAKGKGKELTADIQEGVGMFGERSAILQMLSVLLDNSIRYSNPEGEIRLRVWKKRNRLYMEVFNNCDYEMPPDADRLFDRFYRPDDSRNTDTGGTGIGLAVAKAVVEAHGGTIRASCPDGKTMTIKVTL